MAATFEIILRLAVTSKTPVYKFRAVLYQQQAELMVEDLTTYLRLLDFPIFAEMVPVWPEPEEGKECPTAATKNPIV